MSATVARPGDRGTAARELLGGATPAELRALGRRLGFRRVVLAPLRTDGRATGLLAPPDDDSAVFMPFREGTAPLEQSPQNGEGGLGRPLRVD